MGRSGRIKKKLERERGRIKSVDKTISESPPELPVDSENIVYLKVTVRRGARIESVPLKKLERLASRKKLLWKYEDGWLKLYAS